MFAGGKLTSEVDPETERKARRAVRLLYAVMIVFIVLPFVLWWLRAGR